LTLCWEVVDRPINDNVTQVMRRPPTMRSFITIGVFVIAAVSAAVWPLVSMG
jgi:hypothetical protein